MAKKSKSAALGQHVVLPWLDTFLQGQAPSHPAHVTAHNAAFLESYLSSIFNLIVGYGYVCEANPVIQNAEAGVIVFYIGNDLVADTVQRRIPHILDVPIRSGSSWTNRQVRTAVHSIGSLRPIATATPAYHARSRPCHPGCSISHIQMGSGTIGLVVSPEDDPNHPYILSCNHVLVNKLSFKKGDKIIQPGKSDLGGDKDVIARLHSCIPFDLNSKKFENVADAAIAKINNLTDINHKLPVVGEISSISNHITTNMQVSKIGRTSGQTFSRVIDSSARLRIPHSHSNGSEILVGFRDLVLCTPFSWPGDSGSAVLSESNSVLGLVIAGSDRASVFCRIKPIFDKLKLSLWRGRK